MHPIINIAVSAARKAGDLMVQAQERLHDVKVMEKAENDYVTNIDQQAEQIIIETLRKAYPHHSVLGEESGLDSDDSEYLWIIDPIDGTRNFLHGFPHFCVSIALQIKDKVEHGVIYDPIRQDLFIASRGAGAYINNKRMRVSNRIELGKSLIGCGFPFRRSEETKQVYFNLFNAMIPHCGDFRRAGSAALDLAYVATGRLDGFIELSLKPWDIAAGALMVKEAGGLVGSLDGGENYLKTGDIIAGNPKVFKQLLQLANQK